MAYIDQFVVARNTDTRIRNAAATAKVKQGQIAPVKNSAGAQSHNGTINVNPNTKAVTDIRLPATAAIVDSAQQLVIPITGTYATKITLTVVNGVVTAGVLS